MRTHGNMIRWVQKSAMIALLCLAPATGRGNIIANYRSGFQTGSPAAGWSFLWNAPTGWPGATNHTTASLFSSATTFSNLVYAPAGGIYTPDGNNEYSDNFPAAYLLLNSTGGHPGVGANQITPTVPGANDRFAIAAYTVSQTGDYSLTNAWLTRPAAGANAIQVVVLRPDRSVAFNQNFPGAVSNNFNCAVGLVLAGQTIYVAVGPNANADSDTFAWDFAMDFVNQPTVDAGPDQTIRLPQNTATLNGSGTAVAGSIVSYQWQQTSGPTATLSGTNTPTLSVANLLEGIYVFRLTVTDSGGRTNADSATVRVTPAKNAGVFYSTLYAYNPAYRMTRMTNFGVGAKQRLLKDVNGDGKDDAVAIFYTNTVGLRVEAAVSNGTNFVNPSTWLTWAGGLGTDKAILGDVTGDGRQDVVFFRPANGEWHVAVSSGTNFAAPVLWNAENGVGSDFQFLADLNADGKADAIISWKTFHSGDWRGGLSSGSNFGGFSIYKQNYGSNQTHFACDMNGDKKADFITYQASTGNSSVGLNGGTNRLNIETGFVTNAEFTTVCDVDKNGAGDLVYVDGDEAWVRYFTTNLVPIQPRHRWIAQGRSQWRGFYTNDTVTALASMDGSGYAQLFCSYNGWWQAFPPNPNKSVTVVGVTVNTWETWPSRYLPRNPASQNPHDYGYYDSGDPNVNDAQIRRMHDLGFTYIMFDITNGSHDWVDNRARAFMTRIRAWNNSLKPGQRPMYFCIALGNTRSTTTQASFLTTLESECQRAWNEFYSANLDIVYYLHGKPLVIHMLDSTDKNFWYSVTNWAGQRTNFDRLTNRTFREFDHYVGDAPYGWVVLPATPSQDPDLMTVQPGFGNGATYYPHNNGDRFKSHWNQVLQADPQSVFVVSITMWSNILLFQRLSLRLCSVWNGRRAIGRTVSGNFGNSSVR